MSDERQAHFHSNNAPKDSFQDCLCLICRQVGHVVKLCPRVDSASASDETPPPFPPFEPVSTSPKSSASESVLCDRCHQLNALAKIASHRPFAAGDTSPKKVRKILSQIPSLGPISSLRLHTCCPLCNLLFNITSLSKQDLNDGSQDLLLIIGWTIHRFEIDIRWYGCDKGKGPFSKCAYTSVARSKVEETELVDEAVDAIALVDTGERAAKSEPVLGVRKVYPHACDYDVIKHWLRRCDDLHPTTGHPTRSEGLKRIKLVDVETRQIVAYPSGGCDYIALSYVWGGVVQPSFRLGDILPTIPATLEDAMVVTRNLGKRYLWADSLCIDQGNNEKAEQIALMSAIYTGAWATIICLSGRSARSGLPRVGTLQAVVPQLSCEIWEMHFLSLMPTLAQQISWSPWATRAWTYQEGLLSPRRIFFTNHQVYFECNVIQCCESLDDSDSPSHIATEAQRQAALDKLIDDDGDPTSILGFGIFRDPFRPLSTNEAAQIDWENFHTYSRLLHDYTTKKMSNDGDSLNAFSAVLTRLAETRFTKGFIQGLPLDDLPRALLWEHEAPPRRRDGFAAWSWAGWEGPVSENAKAPEYLAYDFTEVNAPPVKVWKAGKEGRLESIYDFNPTSWILEAIEAGPALEADDDSDWDQESSSNSTSPKGQEDEESWEDMDSNSSVRSKDAGSYNFNRPIYRQSDPVTVLAKEMLSKTPGLPECIGSNELLIEGIIVRLTFIGNDIEFDDHRKSSDRDGKDSNTNSHDHGDSEDDNYSYDSDADELENQCFVLVKINGQTKKLSLRFFGHDAAELVRKRSRKEQEFLLLSRTNWGSTFYNSLLLLDWEPEGDVASRTGAAVLRLNDVKQLEWVKPERRLVKLG